MCGSCCPWAAAVGWRRWLCGACRGLPVLGGRPASLVAVTCAGRRHGCRPLVSTGAGATVDAVHRAATTAARTGRTLARQDARPRRRSLSCELPRQCSLREHPFAVNSCRLATRRYDADAIPVFLREQRGAHGFADREREFTVDGIAHRRARRCVRTFRRRTVQMCRCSR